MYIYNICILNIKKYIRLIYSNLNINSKKQFFPINYSEILFWFVDKKDKNWIQTLDKYLDPNGNKINLFDYVVIEHQIQCCIILK